HHVSYPGSTPRTSSHSPQPHPVRLSCPGSTRRPPPRPSDLPLPTTSVIPVRHPEPPLTRHSHIPSASVVPVRHLRTPSRHATRHSLSLSVVPVGHHALLPDGKPINLRETVETSVVPVAHRGTPLQFSPLLRLEQEHASVVPVVHGRPPFAEPGLPVHLSRTGEV